MTPADKKKMNGKSRGDSLKGSVKNCLEQYFKDLDGHDSQGIYEMVLSEVEPAMLETVLAHTGGNQTQASEILGINRSTLRKKLKHYGIEL